MPLPGRCNCARRAGLVAPYEKTTSPHPETRMTPAAPPSRPPARPAAEVAAAVSLSDNARALLPPALTARQFLDALAAAPLPDDAIRFLAAALPKREAVWWGVLCARAS